MHLPFHPCSYHSSHAPVYPFHHSFIFPSPSIDPSLPLSIPPISRNKSIIPSKPIYLPGLPLTWRRGPVDSGKSMAKCYIVSVINLMSSLFIWLCNYGGVCHCSLPPHLLQLPWMTPLSFCLSPSVLLASFTGPVYQQHKWHICIFIRNYMMHSFLGSDDSYADKWAASHIDRQQTDIQSVRQTDRQTDNLSHRVSELDGKFSFL